MTLSALDAGRPPAGGAATAPLDDDAVAVLRRDFPLLSRTVGDAPLAYLDSGATAQRPRSVLDAERAFLETSNAAVHRGAHTLASEATDAFEDARAAVAAFVGREPEELVWTRNATEAINLVAIGLSDPASGTPLLGAGDEVLVTEAEHHANLVPWQQACARSGARLRWIPLGEDGRLDLSGLADLVTPRTRVVAFTHASNVLGSVTDVAALVAAARSVGALTVLDACQTAPHQPLDLAALGVDFAAFSAHKMLGPNGIGALAARAEALATLPPVLTGGSMVDTVTMELTTFREPPQRFEAGTQAVSQAVAWHAAVRYLEAVGMDRVAAWEHELTLRLLQGVADLPGIRVIGPVDAADRVGAVSVAVDGVHPHDVGQVLDAAGVAVRVGHHCAQPVHRHYGVTASTRASVALYTTTDEVDRFLDALSGVRAWFGRA
ncbi:MAG: SufS family cysteine desulfurase [Kineosporiaceae bacterium]